MTNPDQVYRLGNYHMRSAIYRPEIHTFQTDLEYIVCTAGDRVEFQNDAILVGLASGRVVDIKDDTVNTTFTIDANDINMDGTTQYAITIRAFDGQVYTWLVDSTVVKVEEDNVVVPGFVNTTEVKVGDLLTFGESGKVTLPLLVKNITVCGLNMGYYVGWSPDDVRHKYAGRMRELMAQLFEWFEQGHLHPIVSHTFALADFQEAMTTVLGRQSIGRVKIGCSAL